MHIVRLVLWRTPNLHLSESSSDRFCAHSSTLKPFTALNHRDIELILVMDHSEYSRASLITRYLNIKEI